MDESTVIAPTNEPVDASAVVDANPIDPATVIQSAIHNAPAQPWLEAANDLPDGWRLNGQGLYRLADAVDPVSGAVTQIAIRIAGPVWVAGQVRTAESGDWSRVVKWIDRDHRLHEQTISNARLHEASSPLCGELARGGLKICHRKEGVLMEYLTNCEPPKRYRLAAQTGWIDRDDGVLLYVRPGQIQTSAMDVETYCYAGHFSPVKSAGTLEDWQDNVASLCADHPYLVFALCCAFAGPLLRYSGIESGGFTLAGLTTAGKTTALQVASSVWGHGGDPGAFGEMAYCRSWSMTPTALESVAASHNDSLLCLDELGKADRSTYSRMVYLISGGSGKARGLPDGEMRALRSWRVFILSSGELSSADKISEGGGKAKGGQLLRLLDIHIPQSGIFSHGQDSALADNLKRVCARFYGTAGPAFISHIIDADATGLHEKISRAVQSHSDMMTPSGATPETKRAIKKFALVKIAGLVAAGAGVLPFGMQVVQDSIQFVLNAWISDRQGDSSDPERALSDLRNFLLANRSRMMYADESATHVPPKLIGYVHRRGSLDNEPDLFLMTAEGLKEAVTGHDVRMVLCELDKRGLLKTHKGFKCRAHIEAIGQKVWLYAVLPGIFDVGHEADQGTGAQKYI